MCEMRTSQGMPARTSGRQKHTQDARSAQREACWRESDLAFNDAVDIVDLPANTICKLLLNVVLNR